MICPLGAQVGVRVDYVEGSPPQKYAVAGAARMGEVALFHNHHGVLHTVVQKVYLEVCQSRIPAL